MEFFTNLHWVQCVILVFALYCSMFIKRLSLIFWKYGLLDKGYGMVVHDVIVYYAEYDAEQECHFYSMVCRDGILWDIAALEPFQGVDVEKGRHFDHIEVNVTGVAWTGVIECQTLEDGWYEEQ